MANVDKYDLEWVQIFVEFGMKPIIVIIQFIIDGIALNFRNQEVVPEGVVYQYSVGHYSPNLRG